MLLRVAISASTSWAPIARSAPEARSREQEQPNASSRPASSRITSRAKVVFSRVSVGVPSKRESDSASVPAEVSVKTVNLTGQLKNVAMREIEEQDAVYYIGETPVANRETLVFDISVTPEGASNPSEVRFKRQFFSD